MTRLLPFLLAALVALPAAADTRLFGYRIAALPDGKSFQVAGRVGDTGPDFFCGAALYAKRVLGARGGDHLVIVEPVTRVQGDRVATFQLFSDRPANLPPSAISLTGKTIGENKTVNGSRVLCRKPAVRAFGVTKNRGFPFHF